MTEKTLYDTDGVFHNIVKQSGVMQGRYAVLPNGSDDLNRGNLLTGIELPADKYPLVACLPPISDMEAGFQRWEYFIIRLLFLDTTSSDGTSAFMTRDFATNTDLRTIPQIWQQMKDTAFSFLAALDNMQDRMRGHFIIDEKTPYRFVRVSSREKDNVSGQLVQFKIGLGNACAFTDIADYNQIQIPLL